MDNTKSELYFINGSEPSNEDYEIIPRANVILPYVMLSQIYESVDLFFKKEGHFYTKYNIPKTRSILLHGPAGNGKNTLATSILSTTGDVISVKCVVTKSMKTKDISTLFDDVNYIRSHPESGELCPLVLIVKGIESLDVGVYKYFLDCMTDINICENMYIISIMDDLVVDTNIILKTSIGIYDRIYKIDRPNIAHKEKYLKMKGISKFMDDQKLSNLISVLDNVNMSELNEVYRICAIHYDRNTNINLDKIIAELK